MPAKKAITHAAPAASPDQPTPGETTLGSGTRRRHSEKRRVPGAVIRAVRRSLGYTREELRQLLRVGSASLARYELTDAPPWMSYVLISIGVVERGVPVDEMIRRVVAEEEAFASRTTRGHDDKSSTPRRKPAGEAARAVTPRSTTSKRAGRGAPKRASKSS